jgi:hypothetical protein
MVVARSSVADPERSLSKVYSPRTWLPASPSRTTFTTLAGSCSRRFRAPRLSSSRTVSTDSVAGLTLVCITNNPASGLDLRCISTARRSRMAHACVEPCKPQNKYFLYFYTYPYNIPYWNNQWAIHPSLLFRKVTKACQAVPLSILSRA